MNLKLPRVIILLLLFFCFLQDIKAVSIIGSEARWKNLHNDTFEITMVVYNRCTSSSTPLDLSNLPPSLTSDSCSNNYSVSFGNAFSYVIDDVTQLCASQQSPCTISGGNGSSTASIPLGVERHTIKYKVFLGGYYANCCWYKLKWTFCCRSSNITTGYGDSIFVNEFLLNRCISGSSPEFNANILYLRCTGQDITYNIQAVDADRDSLSYSLTTPLGGHYNSPWSATYPFTCLGGNNPNFNSSPPTGFNLNTATGDIAFRPMQVQISVLKITVKEWRTINGIPKVIGVTNRDMLIVIIQNCNNKLPSLSTEPTKYLCAGDQTCFTIYSNDYDLADTTRFIYSNVNSMPGATFTTSSNNVKYAYGTFCWSPDSTDVRANPYYFVAGVADNKCPANGTGFRSYKIFALPKLDYPIQLEKLSCSSYNFKANNPYPTNIYRRWEVYKGTTCIDSFFYRDTIFNYQFQDTGKFYIKYTGTNLSCTKTIVDSVFIGNINRLNMLVSNDTTICKGNPVTFTATPFNGVAPYNYQWYRNGVFAGNTSSISLTADSNSLFIVRVVSSDSCHINNSDSIYLKIDNSRLQTKPIRDTVICLGKSITFLPSFISGTAPVQYNWYQNGNLISTNGYLTVTPSASHDYVLKMNSADVCYNTFSDTFRVDIDYSKLIVDPISDTMVCAGNQVTFAPVIRQGKAPFTYQWFDLNTKALLSTSPTYGTNPIIDKALILNIYSSDACYNLFSDTVYIQIDNTKIQAQRINDMVVCTGTILNVKPNISSGKAPFQYQWLFNGNLISTADSLSTLVQNSGTYILKITSANQCYNTYADTFYVQADFSSLIVKPIHDTETCVGVGINFTPEILQGKPPMQYRWYKNGQLISNVPILPITLYPGNYVLQITSSDLCRNQHSDTFVINSFPIHELQISSSTLIIKKGEKLVLRTNGMGILTWTGLYIQNLWNDSIEVMPLITTSYTVFGRNKYGCMDTATITINVDATGIKNNNSAAASRFTLQPNPAGPEIEVTFPDGKGQQYYIIDLLGKAQYSGTIHSEKFKINIESLPAGIYFFKAGNGLQKFVKL